MRKDLAVESQPARNMSHDHSTHAPRTAHAQRRRVGLIGLKFLLEKPELAGIALLLLFSLWFGWRSEGVFFSAENWRGMLGLLAEMGLVTLGVALLMVAGEFDLSVGSVFALTPMVMAVAMVQGLGFWLALPLALLVAAALGTVNAVVTLRFAIPSFITTIGMLYIARSLTVVVSGGFPPLLPEDLPVQWFTAFFGPGDMLRASLVWFVVIAVLMALLLERTNLGNWVKATGGLAEAASAMGIGVKWVKLACFIACSVLAGLAGVIEVLRLGSPLPSLGEGLELRAVAGAVIGGVALSGGVGSVLGALIGALLIQVIENGLVITGVDASWFKFAVGALLVLAVVGRAWLFQASRRIHLED